MTRNVDDFLIKLVSDISAIKTTVSSLEAQLAKYEEKLLGPFQEAVHNIKSLESKVESLSEDLASTKEDDIKHLAETTRQQAASITAIVARLDAVKWYIAGGLGVASIFLGLIYQVGSIVLSFYTP